MKQNSGASVGTAMAVAKENDHMENRIKTVESRLDNVETSVNGLSRDVRTLSKEFGSFTGDLKTFMAEQKAHKPHSWKETLGLATQVGILVTMVIGALYFFIDVKTKDAVTRANLFLEKMTDDGKLFVRLDRIENRLDRIEGTFTWEAVPKRKEPTTASSR
jgi:tetrahydromethanopterin S-methyltransferase subunit G